MKIAVYGAFRIGIVEGQHVYDVTAALPGALESVPEQRINWLIAHWHEALPRLLERRQRSKGESIASLRLLPPSPSPSHIFAAPANYHSRVSGRAPTSGRSAREKGFFLKAGGSLLGAGGSIGLPRGSRRQFTYESELAVIIGKPGHDIPRSRAMEHVFGYSCLIDAMMRTEPGVAEEELSMRKSFAGFTPLGPYVVTADEIVDPQALSNRLWLNGELRQDGSTSEMIVGIAELIELVSSVLPLRPGDVIATGTPEGAGQFAAGDTLTVAIEGVGEMRVSVHENAAVSPRPF